MISAHQNAFSQRATFVIVAALWSCSVAAGAITIDTVPVGNVGNSNDPATSNLYGGVGYAYNVGKYEVTVGQYTAFLNAVAATDTYSVYNTAMTTDLNIAGISRTGASGSYSYSVIGSLNHPITYISWGDAARFANWLNNGQPNGAEGAGTTETGAYTLNGAVTSTALTTVTRNAGATWVIPRESEWYKAAYHEPAGLGGDSDDYWAYPMKTNSTPYSDQPPGTALDNTRVGNFYQDDGITNGYDDGYTVTGLAGYSSSQNYLTDAGAYASSPSFYGTFDQGGNVWEWNETLNGSSRGVRGGSWNYSDYGLSGYTQASYRGLYDPTLELSVFGFRVANILAPTLPGDYNNSGTVDAADYVVWRKYQGTTHTLPNDPTGGTIGATQFTTWRANFGKPPGSGSGATVSAAVPEPATIVLLMFAAASWYLLRSRAA